MRKSYFKQFTVVVLAVMLALSLCGCELFGFGNGDDVNDKSSIVYISQEEITLAVGDTIRLLGVSTDGKSVDWLSLDEEIAVVDGDGTVTGVSKGEALIMAFTDDGTSAFCTIIVTDPPTPGTGTPENPDNPDNPTVPTEPEVLVLAMSTIGLTVGGSVTLTATSSKGATITWDSSNKAVATVNNSGRIAALAVGTTVISASTGTATATCNVTVTAAGPAGAEKTGYTLVWYDEFDGTSLDRTKWNYQTGTHDVYHNFENWNVENWGNGELQYYTEDSVTVSGGSLVITAKKQSTSGKDYRSGRILTRDKASWTYGYFEARMKTPTGSGMWPAFWMLPQPSSYDNINNKYGGWPYNGEIDIMEAKGSRYNKVDTTLHYGPISDGGWQSQYNTTETTLSSNTDQWHTYAVEWKPTYIKWFVDGNPVQTVSSDTWYSRSEAASGNSRAPFDQPFYIILNLAVGGQYDNWATPDGSFTSANMYVDYVRVYEAI
ncbi:MAG: family 16 glycosylhydrolase [Clostridiales bacterium]|nr:family 16 glycosylhydrolase [Clostridiales bacterium]